MVLRAGQGRFRLASAPGITTTSSNSATRNNHNNCVKWIISARENLTGHFAKEMRSLTKKLAELWFFPFYTIMIWIIAIPKITGTMKRIYNICTIKIYFKKYWYSEFDYASVTANRIKIFRKLAMLELNLDTKVCDKNCFPHR